MVRASLCACMLGLFMALACGDEADEAEEEITATLDCARLCSEWNDCHEDATGEDVDVTACTDSCEDRADADEAWRQAADACSECLDETDDCGSCWAQCPSFPLPTD